MPELFGEKLRALRRQHNLTQAVLAHRLGLASHSHIVKLEAKQDPPSLALIVRTAQFFNISLDYLLRDTLPVNEETPSRVTKSIIEPFNFASFSLNLKNLRQRNGLSQLELARKLNLARQGYVSNLETGRKTPSPELVVSIADLFDVTTDDIVGTNSPNLPS